MSCSQSSAYLCASHEDRNKIVGDLLTLPGAVLVPFPVERGPPGFFGSFMSAERCRGGLLRNLGPIPGLFFHRLSVTHFSAFHDFLDERFRG